MNSTPDYRGGDNNASWDAISKTLLGRPASSISSTAFRTYARNLGSINWNKIPYGARRSVVWLARVEYANLNCQLAINAAKDVNGYAQGGLGDGVTNMSSTEWAAFNNYNPFVPCGYTNSLGNFSGELTYNAVDFGGTGVTRTTKANRYRGIENFFGHISEWTEELLIEMQSDAAGGLSKIWYCNNPENYSDSDFSNYTLMGYLPRTDGYIKESILGEILPSNTVGGGSTTFFCDYAYMANLPASGTVLRGVFFGGNATYGALAGFGFASTYSSPSYAIATIGSRLCFLGA
jgi:hypothetical protein